MNIVRCPAPKGGSKTENGRFRCKIALRLKKVCYKVSFCENCQRQSCKTFIGLTILAKMIGGGDPFCLKFWTALERNRQFSMYFRSQPQGHRQELTEGVPLLFFPPPPSLLSFFLPSLPCPPLSLVSLPLSFHFPVPCPSLTSSPPSSPLLSRPIPSLAPLRSRPLKPARGCGGAL